MTYYKNKKIVALIGSNNPNSITKQIVNLLKENLIARNKHVDFKILDSQNLNIRVCQGCNTCFEKGFCPLDFADDMKELKKLLDEADIVILACPVYLLHVSSPMKILLDRISYWCHLLKLRNKLLVTVVTTSRSGARGTNDYLKNMGLGFGMLPISEIVFEHDNDIKELIKKINKSAYIISQYINGLKKYHSNELLEQVFAQGKKDRLQQLETVRINMILTIADLHVFQPFVIIMEKKYL